MSEQGSEQLAERDFLYVETNKALALLQAYLTILQGLSRLIVPEKCQELADLIQDFREKLENYL